MQNCLYQGRNTPNAEEGRFTTWLQLQVLLLNTSSHNKPAEYKKTFAQLHLFNAFSFASAQAMRKGECANRDKCWDQSGDWLPRRRSWRPSKGWRFSAPTCCAGCFLKEQSPYSPFPCAHCQCARGNTQVEMGAMPPEGHLMKSEINFPYTKYF